MNLKKSLILIFLITIQTNIQAWWWFNKPEKKQEKEFTLILNPYGDATTFGRLITDTQERNLTFELANKIKDSIEKKYSNVQVILTHAISDNTNYLENINFANKSKASLYLSLNFFQSNKNKPEYYIYYPIFNTNETEIKQGVNLLAYNDAYKLNIEKSKNYGKKLFDSINGTRLIGAPLKSLTGINAPAIGLEFGIKSAEDLQVILEPAINNIELIINLIINPT